jgi:outer membrane protein assembly factor BamB
MEISIKELEMTLRRIAVTSAVLLILVVPSLILDPTTSLASPPPAPDASRNADGSWLQWGGPSGDFQVASRPLSRDWGETGPKALWSRDLGKGYSAIAADKGTLYTMYRIGDDEIAIALDAATGETRWEHKYNAPTVSKHVVQFGKGPNASPLVLDDRIITLGYTGVLNAINRADGQPLWTHDLIKEYAGEVLVFGSSASPIVHNNMILVLVGGDQAAVMAFAPDTGKVIWKSKAGSVSYAAPQVIDVDGQEQAIYYSADAINGLDAATGTSLWSHPVATQYKNNCSNPIWGKDNLLWVASQLDGGTRVLRLSLDGEATKVEEVWAKNTVNLHWWNTIRLGGLVFGSMGAQGSALAAVNVETGEVAWRERGYDKVKPIQVGELTLMLDADGDLYLAELKPDGINVLTQARIFESDESWTIPTLVGTTLFARDQNKIVALQLGAAN